MFLHIGNSKNILCSKIIGIFDLDTATVSADTREFLKTHEKNGDTDTAAEELPKSFILTDDNKVILSQISTSTLQNREI